MQSDPGRFDRSKRLNSSNNKKTSRQRSSSPRAVETRFSSSLSSSSISSSSLTSTTSTSSSSSSPTSSSSSSSSSLHTQDCSSLHRRKSEMVAYHGLPSVRRQNLPKALSEPHISYDSAPDKSECLKVDRDSRLQSSCRTESAQFTPRRCMTDYSIQTAKAPDLLQLFNIFQFNTAELPPARMLVNVTLVGSIQGIRLLVDCDASVQDVTKAALKAFAKEGRLPRYSYKHQTYGLHFSPFCLESINPGDAISSLGTRSFYLSPSSQISPDVSEDSGEGKSWWKALSFLFT